MQPGPGFALQRAKGRRATALLLPILVFAIVAVARIIYVSLYAAPLPFWDQWDELDRQIRPWFDGTSHILQLFEPHNQHRIAFTRIISLLLASANGRVFDNLVEAYANAFIYAALWAVLYPLLVHRDTSQARSRLGALVVVVLGVLPFDWENTLIGFQNQFYIMGLLAVATIGVAAYRRLSVGTIFLLTLLAGASLFTMGSGLLAAPAACFALLLCTWRKPAPWSRLLVALSSMALITVAGLILLKDGTPVESLRATGVLDFLRGLLVAMTWPLHSRPSSAARWIFAVLLWAPGALWLWCFYRTRRAEANEVFAVSLAGWVFLQCMAIAYSRGHDASSLSSRYSEIAALGLAANAWLALKLAARWPDAHWAKFAIGAAVVLVGWIFWQRTPGDLSSMKERHTFAIIETRNVQHYLAGLPLPAVPEGSLAMPYPKVQRLRSLLDNPEIRALLPPAAFPQPAPSRHAPLSAFAAAIQNSIRAWFPKSVWSVGAHELEMLTPSAFRSYNSPAPSHASNPQCSLDAINGQPAVAAKPIPRSGGVTFGGWMGDGRGQFVAKGLLILKGADHSYAVPFVTGTSRPDVAKAWNSQAMARSGYNLTATLNGVEAGTYSLLVTDSADPSVWCDLRRTLIVY